MTTGGSLPVSVDPLGTLAARAYFGVGTACAFLASQFWAELDLAIDAPTFMWMAILALGSHLVLVRRIASPTDPVVWIPIAMIVFYFGTPVAFEILGATGDPADDAWGALPSSSLDHAYCLALLCLLGFVLGLHLRGIRRLDPDSGSVGSDGDSILPVGIVLLTVSAAMMLIGIALIGPGVVFGRYGDVWMQKSQGADFRIFNVGMLLARTAVLAIVASHTRRLQSLTWGALGLALGLLVLAAYLGDRSTFVAFPLALGWIFSQRVRRVPGPVVVVAAFVGLTLLPIIGEYRETRSTDQLEQASPLDVFRYFFRETGATIQTFAYTLDYVPQEKEYGYGMSYVRALGGLIPNLGLETGKDYLPAPEQYDPGYWLPLTIAPDKITGGGAFGYSLGGELYFNFGVPGVLLGAILVGYVTALVRNDARRSPMRLLWSGLVFSATIIAVRNSMNYPLMVALWPLVAVVALRALRRDLLAVGQGLTGKGGLGDRSGTVSG